MTRQAIKRIIVTCVVGLGLFLAGGLAAEEDYFKNPFWYSSMKIEPGTYEVGKVKIVISRKTEKDKFSTIEISPKTTIKNGTIFVQHGYLKGKGCTFENVRFEEELNSSFEFKDTIFINCKFAKGGGWFVSKYSAKFNFENCVFLDTFFDGWAIWDTGIRAESCSFYNVKFPEYKLKNDKNQYDPSVELDVKQPANFYSKCLFEQCEIPESCLVFMSSSLFKKCVFKEEEVIVGKAMTVKNALENHEDEYLPGKGKSGKIKYSFSKGGASARTGSSLKLDPSLLLPKDIPQ